MALIEDKMITMKQEMREVEVIDKVHCNYCAQEIINNGCGYEYATLLAHWGYTSKHDMEKYELHICETCVYTHIMPSIKIQPFIREEL